MFMYMPLQIDHTLLHVVKLMENNDITNNEKFNLKRKNN